MKKLIGITALLMLMGSLKINAQVIDTLAYLKSLEAKKSKFIGQPFFILNNSLAVNFSVFYPVANKAFNKYAEISTIF